MAKEALFKHEQVPASVIAGGLWFKSLQVLWNFGYRLLQLKKKSYDTSVS